MKIATFVLLISVLFVSELWAQKKYLTEIYAKTDSEIVAIVDKETNAEFSYMQTVIGRKIRGLMEAVLDRGYSPNDFGGSITTAYQVAVDSSGWLIIPGDYSTDSTVTYTTAPIVDFRNGTVTITPFSAGSQTYTDPFQVDLDSLNFKLSQDSLIFRSKKTGGLNTTPYIRWMNVHPDNIAIQQEFYNNDPTATDNHEIVYTTFTANNDVGNRTIYADFAARATAVTNLAESGSIDFRVLINGSGLATAFYADGGGISTNQGTIILNQDKRDFNVYIFTDTDTALTVDAGAETINMNVATSFTENPTVGIGAAGVDYVLNFNGEDNDGTITWQEDENFFRANRYVAMPRAIDFDIIAWFPPATNGATLTTVGTFEEVYAFSDNDTLFNKFRLPPSYSTFDSVEIFISPQSTNGDSAAISLYATGKTVGETWGAFSLTGADTLDLGGTANARGRMVIYPSVGILAAGDEVMWYIVRDGSISNNDASDVNVERVTFYVQ